MPNNLNIIPVFAPVRPASSTDKFPSAWSDDILGGHHQETTIAGRDIIPDERRKIGMTCYVAETDIIYVLKSGVSNSNWANILEGSNTPISTNAGYFLDSVYGYDSNDGLGVATPLKTVSRLLQITSGNFNNGRLSIARDSYFEEQLTVNANNGVIASYGQGALPLFDCRKIIPSFVKLTGYSNIYQTTITLPGAAKMEGNAWADDYMIPQVSGLSQCDITTGSFYVPNWRATGVTDFYMSVPSGTVPIIDGKTYRYSAREFGVLVTGTNTKLVGIRTKGNGAQDGGIKVIGTGARLTAVRCDDGTRHACYTQAGSVFEDCYFYRGRNDLEPPGTANSLDVNQSVITGTSWETINCVFDGGDGGLYTGPFGHGALETDLFDSIKHTNPKFINTYSCVAATAKDLQILTPGFTNCQIGVSWSSPGCTVNLSGGTGSINRMTNVTSSGTFISKNSNYTVPFVGVGFYRYDSGTGNVGLQITGESVNVIDGPTTNNQYIRHLFGPIQVNSTTVIPSLCNPLDDILVAGFGSGAATYSGANNLWPFGARFQLNGTTYNTLAAFQSGGFDTTSATAPFPATVSSDDFNRPDEFLDLSSGWTKVSGTANQVAVRSGQLAITSATSSSYYQRAEMSSPDHWVKFTLTAAPASAGAYVGFRVLDANNWMGVRATNTAFQIGKCISGVVTASVVGSSALTPASGQSVVVAIKGDKAWLYVEGRCLNRGGAMSAPTLAAASGVGIIGRGPLLPYFIDNFECGVVPTS